MPDAPGMQAGSGRRCLGSGCSQSPGGGRAWAEMVSPVTALQDYAPSSGGSRPRLVRRQCRSGQCSSTGRDLGVHGSELQPRCRSQRRSRSLTWGKPGYAEAVHRDGSGTTTGSDGETSLAPPAGN